MLHTITMGAYVSVQGLFVKSLPDGRVQVRVGRQLFVGKPVSQAA
jgi:hypothetical protein